MPSRYMWLRGSNLLIVFLKTMKELDIRYQEFFDDMAQELFMKNFPIFLEKLKKGERKVPKHYEVLYKQYLDYYLSKKKEKKRDY